MKIFRLLFCSCAILLACSTFAQSENRAAVRKQAVDDAKTLFLAGDGDEQAERKLTDANQNPRNTAEWHLESANELLQMAFALTREGKPERAGDLARRALQHTRQAANRADRPALAAAAEETAAFIHERLLGDYAAAKAGYQSATQRHPQGGAARELDRLNKLQQEADRRTPAPRG